MIFIHVFHDLILKCLYLNFFFFFSFCFRLSESVSLTLYYVNTVSKRGFAHRQYLCSLFQLTGNEYSIFHCGYHHCGPKYLVNYFPGGSDGKKICLQCGKSGFDLWVRKISWRREWLSTPVFLPGELQGQRSLVGYSLQDCKEQA